MINNLFQTGAAIQYLEQCPNSILPTALFTFCFEIDTGCVCVKQCPRSIVPSKGIVTQKGSTHSSLLVKLVNILCYTSLFVWPMLCLSLSDPVENVVTIIAIVKQMWGSDKSNYEF